MVDMPHLYPEEKNVFPLLFAVVLTKQSNDQMIVQYINTANVCQGDYAAYVQITMLLKCL
jgi:hypothetical protein